MGETNYTRVYLCVFVCCVCVCVCACVCVCVCVWGAKKQKAKRSAHTAGQLDTAIASLSTGLQALVVLVERRAGTKEAKAEVATPGLGDSQEEEVADDVGKEDADGDGEEEAGLSPVAQR